MKPDQYNLKPGHVVLVLTGVVALFLLFPALAELEQRPWNRDYDVILPAVRIWMILGSSMAGFALGWFLSPQASELRAVVGAVAMGVVLCIATFDDSALGWGLAVLLALAGFFMALGYWLGRVVRALAEKPITFGSAKWADSEELREREVFGTKGYRLGRFHNGTCMERISYSGDRHMLTVAPTRKGKGTAQIIPELLTHEGSVMVIDPKGENALITACQRVAMGQAVQVLDPWQIARIDGIETARFNPMDWLQIGDVDIAENAMLLADAIIIMGDSEKFWDEEAKALLVGVILYVATAESEAGQRHLPRVRDLLLLDGEDLGELFEQMMASPLHMVASAGARCLQKDDKLLSNVMATVQSHTHFLDSARIRESMSASDFRFEDLKTSAMSVYLVLPADRLNAFSRWLRLMVQQAITVNARNIEEKPEHPVLFVLDEMPALGRLSMVEQAYGLMAGFGMQLHGIVQDLSQLKSVYGEGWETFIGNSGMVQYFGSRDRFTAEYFSALCGETTVWNFSSAIARTFGSSSSANGVTTSSSTTETDTTAAAQRKLAYADELMRMHADKQLVVIDNLNPIIAHKVRWFEDEDLKAKGVNLHDV